MVLSKFKTRLACCLIGGLLICVSIHAQPPDFLQVGHTLDLLYVGWNPEGNLVASFAADHKIKVWNAITGQLLWDIDADLLKPEAPLKSPDGTMLASGLRGESYQILEAQSGKRIWTIKDRAAGPERVASPDGSMIAERGRYGDACVKIFEARSNKLIRRLEGHPGIVHAIVFSPDGKVIASGGGDKRIRFWNAQTGVVTKTLAEHTKKITSLAFSGDGKRLISGSEDDTVKIWKVDDGRLLRSITTHTDDFHGVKTVAFSTDGQTALSSGDREIRIWDTATGKQLHVLTTNDDSEVRYVAFNPKGNLIVSAHDDGTIRLWDAIRARLLRVMKGRFNDTRVAAFSPDGQFIASGYYSENARMELWSVRTGRLIRRFGKDSDYVQSLSFSRDGTMIATGHILFDIKVWSTRTGKVIKSFKQTYSSDDQVAFSPDGKHVVSGGENQNILLWNVKSGSLLWSAIPLDWETERRSKEAAAKRFAAEAGLEAEREQRTEAADKEVKTWVRPVTISFDHYGEATNPLEQRMMEKGGAEKSLITKTEAEDDGVWLRLKNNSPLPIIFRTDSGYLPRPGCGVKLSNGSNAGGLCDGAEVSIQYEIEEANGKPVPWGLDMSWNAVLPPGASVLFSVSKSHLEKRRTVFVSYTYLKESEQRKLEEYGTARRVSFRKNISRKGAKI